MSYGAFVHCGFSLSAHVIAWRECWLSTPVSSDHINRNEIVYLDYYNIKIFSLLGVLSTLIFILWGFCPIVLLSIVAFLCPPTWSHDENVDCPHLHHVITWTEMGLYTLIVGVLKYFLFWGFCPLWFLSFGSFVLWCFCPFWLFSVHPHDRMTRMLIVHTCIMWSHEQKWDRTHWLLEFQNIFSFGCFVRFNFYPLFLLSYGAFVHFGFSLSAHVIAWRECWLSTPVSCDHMNRNGIIHLDCWSINSYSASHDKWCTAILWNRIMTAQCEGMGEVGSARNKPALLPPCPSIRVLSCSNCQEIHSCQQTGLAV